MRSIQTKLILSVMLIVILLGLTIGVVSLNELRKSNSNNAHTILEKICEKEQESIDEIFEHVQTATLVMATQIENTIESVDDLKDPIVLEQHLSNVRFEFDTVAEIINGSVGYYYRLNVEMFDSRAGFFYIRDDNDSEFEYFETTDISEFEKDDIEHVGWYYLPVDAKKATWIDPYMNLNINKNIISYVIPIYVDEVLLGVVGVDIDFQYLMTVIGEIEVYETGFAYLVSQDGKIAYHDNHVHNILEESDFDDHRFQSNLVNNMKLVLSVSNKEINRSSNELISRLAMVVILFIILAIVIISYVSARIIKPLKDLTVATQRIAAGDKDVMLYVNSLDEVGILANSFQHAIDTINNDIEYINKLTYIDSLTGVKNSTAYIEKISELNQLIKDGEELAVIVFDINYLKQVNDDYGHEFGNELIIKGVEFIAKIFNNLPIYRIGGDEFVVILEKGEVANANSYVNRFDIEIAKLSINKGNINIPVEIARGLAVYEQGVDTTYNSLFKRADDQMYINKKELKQK